MSFDEGKEELVTRLGMFTLQQYEHVYKVIGFMFFVTKPILDYKVPGKPVEEALSSELNWSAMSC